MDRLRRGLFVGILLGASGCAGANHRHTGAVTPTTADRVVGPGVRRGPVDPFVAESRGTRATLSRYFPHLPWKTASRSAPGLAEPAGNWPARAAADHTAAAVAEPEDTMAQAPAPPARRASARRPSDRSTPVLPQAVAVRAFPEGATDAETVRVSAPAPSAARGSKAVARSPRDADARRVRVDVEPAPEPEPQPIAAAPALDWPETPAPREEPEQEASPAPTAPEVEPAVDHPPLVEERPDPRLVASPAPADLVEPAPTIAAAAARSADHRSALVLLPPAEDPAPAAPAPEPPAPEPEPAREPVAEPPAAATPPAPEPVAPMPAPPTPNPVPVAAEPSLTVESPSPEPTAAPAATATPVTDTPPAPAPAPEPEPAHEAALTAPMDDPAATPPPVPAVEGEVEDTGPEPSLASAGEDAPRRVPAVGLDRAPDRPYDVEVSPTEMIVRTAPEPPAPGTAPAVAPAPRPAAHRHPHAERPVGPVRSLLGRPFRQAAGLPKVEFPGAYYPDGRAPSAALATAVPVGPRESLTGRFFRKLRSIGRDETELMTVPAAGPHSPPPAARIAQAAAEPAPAR